LQSAALKQPQQREEGRSEKNYGNKFFIYRFYSAIAALSLSPRFSLPLFICIFAKLITGYSFFGCVFYSGKIIKCAE
jgi:hypothetical protein